MQEPVEVSLDLWHGLNLPLLLSGVTIAGGLFIYRQRRLLWRHHRTVEALRGPMHVYERGLAGLVEFAKAITRALQSGAFSRYIFIILGSTTALLLWKFAHFREWPDLAWRGGVDWVPLALCIMVMAGAIVATTTSSRITILFALGIVGLGIAVIFLFYSAPDLAITQILVEALTIILLLMVVHHLAPIRREQHSWGTASQALLSVVFGLCMGLLVLQAKELQLASSIAETLAAWSYPEAHGRNVVNVILVDFRALDTFGEIVVLAIAAIGVAALLRRQPATRKEGT
jgi:multicomponent Na+:H+ antiporter subunit A